MANLRINADFYYREALKNYAPVSSVQLFTQKRTFIVCSDTLR